MAMDKEMLLQKLQTQYLTRQEVLFKLPLNISIDSFWPELLERRKLNSIVLPLHRADGKPLWYVLTDKMIAASETLCATALDHNEAIDLYRPGMTGAMTEELFFTSYVEGAQVTLQEAMEFLERGTEPENVQEQLIENNRLAWTDMLRMLYYPLDERLVHMLAYRLTEDMEGQATDYRRTDSHCIAAMGAEAYEVPRAAQIPELMQEYYAFLANTGVHPLIKAAVGQAFLLVTRPFPDGNERLSRLISYAVLLRSGYDFLRDISISGMIARENFRYFKSMQDIIRSENCGDLTYFIEYYLDMLARSIGAKAEMEQRRREEALRLERQAATQPLEKERLPAEEIVLPDADLTGEPVSYRSDDSVGIQIAKEAPEAQEHDMGKEPEARPTESPPLICDSVEEYLGYLQETRATYMGNVQPERLERVTGRLGEMAIHGTYAFRRMDWKHLTGMTEGVARNDIRFMREMGMVICGPRERCSERKVYHLPIRVSTVSGRDDLPACHAGAPEDDRPRGAIANMLRSEHPNERLSAAGPTVMPDIGTGGPTCSEWAKPVPASTTQGACTAEGAGHVRLPDKQREVLLRLMDAFPDEKFSTRNAAEFTGLKYSTIGYYLEAFTRRGILRQSKALSGVNSYQFSNEAHGIFESSDQDGGSAGFKPIPEREKEYHDPLRSMAGAG